MARAISAHGLKSIYYDSTCNNTSKLNRVKQADVQTGSQTDSQTGSQTRQTSKQGASKQHDQSSGNNTNKDKNIIQDCYITA